MVGDPRMDLEAGYEERNEEEEEEDEEELAIAWSQVWEFCVCVKRWIISEKGKHRKTVGSNGVEIASILIGLIFCNDPFLKRCRYSFYPFRNTTKISSSHFKMIKQATSTVEHA